MDNYTTKEKQILLGALNHIITVQASGFKELPDELKEVTDIKPLLELKNKLTMDIDGQLYPGQDFGKRYFDFLMEMADMVEAEMKKKYQSKNEAK